MAEKKVKVTLKVRARGGLRISVHPWSVHVNAGDTVKFSFGGDITRGEITPHARAWPFPGPRHVRGAGTARTRPRRPSVRGGDRQKYNVKVWFQDPVTPASAQRTAVVDPDMVLA